jgi:uncharacterized linocin/CFP29 family protein
MIIDTQMWIFWQIIVAAKNYTLLQREGEKQGKILNEILANQEEIKLLPYVEEIFLSTWATKNLYSAFWIAAGQAWNTAPLIGCAKLC